MNPYVNEEVMWQRLKDVQREAENRRLYGRPSSAAAIVPLARAAWRLAQLAVRTAAGSRPRSMLVRAVRPRWWTS